MLFMRQIIKISAGSHISEKSVMIRSIPRRVTSSLTFHTPTKRDISSCAIRNLGTLYGNDGINRKRCGPESIPICPLFGENMSENIKHVSDSSFEADVLKSDKPVLVDFWAEWCGPCKMIAPILEEVAKEYDGKILIAKMDVDANQAVPAKFGIRGIPTLILFKNGVPAAQKVGALAKGQLTSFIESNI